MSLGLVPVLVAGGGVAYVATQGTQPAASQPGPTQYSPVSGATTSQIIGLAPTAPPSSPTAPVVPVSSNASRLARWAQSGAAQRASTIFTTAASGPTVNWPPGVELDPELQAAFDFLEEKAKEAFDDMDEVAKSKAAVAINEYMEKLGVKMDPPLNGLEDWRTIAIATNTAAGAVIGGYYGGPVGAQIGALVGAYTGRYITDWHDKGYKKVKEWWDSGYTDFKEWTQDKYDDVKDWFSEHF
jgi:hypothetical protein